jgi:hypothetical protein
MPHAAPNRPRARPLAAALLALLAQVAGAGPAHGAPPRDSRVPVALNVGLGPAIGTMVLPGLSGVPPVSLGLNLRIEAYLDARTLHSKRVMRQVPREYRAMVRDSKDIHILPFPTPFLPDQALLLPLTGRSGGPTLRSVGWSPFGLYLVHKVKPAHKGLVLGPRVAWVSLDGDAAAAPAATSHVFFGLDLSPERQSDMQKRWGSALGGRVSPGFVGPRTVAGQEGAGGFGLWVDAYARLQWRTTVRVRP